MDRFGALSDQEKINKKIGVTHFSSVLDIRISASIYFFARKLENAKSEVSTESDT